MKPWTYYVFQLRFLKVFPAITALIVYKRMDTAFRPFAFIIWVGLLNEIISVITGVVFKTNAVNSNIYVLVDGMLVLLQFYRWQFFNQRRWQLYGIAAALIIVWILDNLVFRRLNVFTSYYRIFYSIVFVFISINQMNKLIVTEKGNLLKNAIFLICIYFLIFYSIKIVGELFWVSDAIRKEGEGGIGHQVFQIFRYVNSACNILISFIFIWVPKKQQYTRPY